MYCTSGVIHVWYIRCDSSGLIEMPRRRRPAQPSSSAGPGPRTLALTRAPCCWMAGLAWRLAGGGGGISITPDESHLMYHT